MNIFTFFYKILAKYSPKRTKLHNLLKFSRGSMPPNPPNKRVASPHTAWRFAPSKYPHFSKNILNPPPQKRNPRYATATDKYSLGKKINKIKIRTV